MSDMPAGRPKDLTEEKVVRIMKNADEPFVWPSDIAEETGVSNVTARKVLKRMQANGLVESKQSGSGSGWWLAR